MRALFLEFRVAEDDTNADRAVARVWAGVARGDENMEALVGCAAAEDIANPPT